MRSCCRALTVVAAALFLALFGVAGNVSAAGASMRIDPATQTVAKDATFTVKVVMSNSVPTIGGQASVTFDKSKLQITAVAWGDHFANAPVLIPSDMSGAITQANSTGKLSKLAATFVLPTDSVPAGDTDLLNITFKATGCGNVTLGLPVGPGDASMLDGRDDTVGETLPITASGGSVTINCGTTTSSTPTSQGSIGSTSSAQTGAASAGPSTTAEAAPSETSSGEATAVVEGASAGASQAAEAALPAAGNSSGPNSSLPLWLPLALSIPALAVVGLGLLRWRSMTNP